MSRSFAGGNALEMLGRLDKALQAHQQAMHVAEQLTVGAPKYALAVFNLGQVYRMRGETDQALQLRTDNETPPALIADTRFEFAQALRMAGRDETRSRREASRARDGYAELGLEKLREDVEAWMTRG